MCHLWKVEQNAYLPRACKTCNPHIDSVYFINDLRSLTHKHIFTHIYTHTHAHTYILTYIHTHTYKCSHSYIQTHTHTHTYTEIYTHNTLTYAP